MSKKALFGIFTQKSLAKFVHLLNKIVKDYLKFFSDFDKIIKIMNIEVVFMSKTYVKKEEKERAVPLYLFREGSNSHAYEYFGAHRKAKNSVVFRVWAPDAEAVGLVGDFNDWDVKATPMTALPKSGGVWECVVDGIKQFDSYKFAITAKSGNIVLKCDPYAFHSETRPGTASKFYEIEGCHEWKDDKWIEKRNSSNIYSSPIKYTRCTQALGSSTRTAISIHTGIWRTSLSLMLRKWDILTLSLCRLRNIRMTEAGAIRLRAIFPQPHATAHPRT